MKEGKGEAMRRLRRRVQTTAQKAAGDLGLPGSHCGGGRVSIGRVGS